ncbi:hypothetical protein M6D81_03480 [Paenibacillus sp. J5C_2022]|uniref:hypothetical protein n=1 Tax=Paenibacillus sp. J5C2022 TaxID=2977129 RepID=UPI0021D3761E|nr:hypothetical protein [Paenibacillus sp. J5C2022]MCU6707762.1 hypothetical protein [Paenibacillus sp. J5C2022]
MTKKKKWMKSGIMVVLASSILISGCGVKKEGEASDSALSSTSSGKELPPYAVTMAFYGNDQKDMQTVQVEMNNILKEKINASVNLTPISISAWQQQTNLMLAGNEKIELMITSTGFNYATHVAKGQLHPLDELIEKYGSGIKGSSGAFPTG